MDNSAQELSNNGHSNLHLAVHTAKNHGQVGANKKLDVRNRNTDRPDNLIEDRRQHLRRAVVLLDVLCAPSVTCSLAKYKATH